MKPESTTPRALSALGNGIGNGEHFMHIYPNSYVQSNDNIPISSFYFQDRVRILFFRLFAMTNSTVYEYH